MIESANQEDLSMFPFINEDETNNKEQLKESKSTLITLIQTLAPKGVFSISVKAVYGNVPYLKVSLNLPLHIPSTSSFQFTIRDKEFSIVTPNTKSTEPQLEIGNYQKVEPIIMKRLYYLNEMFIRHQMLQGVNRKQAKAFLYNNLQAPLILTPTSYNPTIITLEDNLDKSIDDHTELTITHSLNDLV